MLALWAPVLAVMAGIFVVSGVPNLTRLPGDISDHTGHFAGYAGLAIVSLRAFAGAEWRGVTWRAAASAWLLSVVYGITDELHQRVVPGRTPAIDDVVADALGAATAGLAGLAIAAIAVRRRQGRTV